MARPVAKFLAGFAILAGVLALTCLILTLRRPLPPSRPLPNPNGYEELVKAAQMLAGKPWELSSLSAEELRTLLATNAEALALARTGLTHECWTPMIYSETNLTFLDGLRVIKALAESFVAEGRLAELDGRPGDAARSYLDAVRVGCAATRGGMIIHSLVGIACESIGLKPLEKLAPTLDAKSCREAAAGLEAAERQRASAAAVLAQEHDWARRSYGFKGQLIQLITYKSLKKTEQGWKAKLSAHEARARRLMLDLAIRAYELEQGQRPKELAALVPVYLKSIPIDPATGTNMVYQP